MFISHRRAYVRGTPNPTTALYIRQLGGNATRLVNHPVAILQRSLSDANLGNLIDHWEDSRQSIHRSRMSSLIYMQLRYGTR